MVHFKEHQRVKSLLTDTITLLCKNGLTFKNEFSVEATIGITLDRENVMVVSINEVIKAERMQEFHDDDDYSDSDEAAVLSDHEVVDIYPDSKPTHSGVKRKFDSDSSVQSSAVKTSRQQNSKNIASRIKAEPSNMDKAHDQIVIIKDEASPEQWQGRIDAVKESLAVSNPVKQAARHSQHQSDPNTGLGHEALSLSEEPTTSQDDSKKDDCDVILKFETDGQVFSVVYADNEKGPVTSTLDVDQSAVNATNERELHDEDDAHHDTLEEETVAMSVEMEPGIEDVSSQDEEDADLETAAVDQDADMDTTALDVSSTTQNASSKINASGIKLFTCKFPDCSYTSKVFSNVQKHEKRHGATKTLLCGYPGCEFSTKVRSNMTRHIVIHTKEYHRCEFCSCKFNCAYSLNKHIMVSHMGKKLQCEHCPKAFTSHQGLKKHLSKVHDQNDVYTCAQCGEQFTNRTLYKSHAKVHTNSNQFKCSKCPKTFGLMSNLKRHEMKCSSVAPVKCNECEGEFPSEAFLKVHIEKVHHRQILTCDCGKQFSWAQSFRRHRKRCSVMNGTNCEKSD